MFKEKSIKKNISLILILIMVLTLLAGCSGDKKEEVKVDEQTEVEVSNESDSRIITDMAGREVEIPVNVERVYPTGVVAMIPVYTINPDKLVGINKDLSEDQLKYLTEDMKDKKVLGTYKGIDSGNEEEVLSANPDLIISFGDINERWIEEANIGQEKLGVPYIMVDGDIDKLADSYRFLGEILGEEEKANELAEYVEKSVGEIKEIADTISEDEKKIVYYASQRGPLVTNVVGSIHTQIIDIVGAKNAAEVEVEKISGGVDVSMEQVLTWNPEIIIAGQGFKDGESSYEEITTSEDWKTIEAVKNNEVYKIPDLPFSWFDSPPSVNRLVGLRWAANIIYPEKYNFDIEEDIKEFFELFYHVELNSEDINNFLNK